MVTEDVEDSEVFEVSGLDSPQILVSGCGCYSTFPPVWRWSVPDAVGVDHYVLIAGLEDRSRPAAVKCARRETARGGCGQASMSWMRQRVELESV